MDVWRCTRVELALVFRYLEFLEFRRQYLSIDRFLQEEGGGKLTSCGPEVDDEAEQDDRECGEVEPERLVMLYQIGCISVIEQ